MTRTRPAAFWYRSSRRAAGLIVRLLGSSDGSSVRRRLAYLARANPFRNPLLRMLLESVETLQRGRGVLLFPEGTRGSDRVLPRGALVPRFGTYHVRIGRPVPLAEALAEGAAGIRARGAELRDALSAETGGR